MLLIFVLFQAPLASNFSMTNNVFLSLNDDIGSMEENIFKDPWQLQAFKTKSNLFSPFDAIEDREIKIEEDQKYMDIFDSDDEAFQKDFFVGLNRPKSSGTIPKSKKLLSSNMSDPCLLSSADDKVGCSEHLPTSQKSNTNASEMNSLDSGILDEGYSGTSQVGK